MLDYAKYSGMGDVNVNDTYTQPNQVDPKDEQFKMVYISGTGQKVDEYTGNRLHVGMYQIKGIENNLETVYMMPYFKRDVLVNRVKKGNFDQLKCFSYSDYNKDGFRQSTSGFFCPHNSSARKEVGWCSTCKMNVILAGFWVKENGEYNMDDNGDPISIYIKASGSKVGDVMRYFFECAKLEVPFLFNDDSDQAKNYEKMYTNIFRRRIALTVSEEDVYISSDRQGAYDGAKTRSGYMLTGDKELSKETIEKLLNYAQKVDADLREKFDFSKKTEISAKKNFNFEQSQFQNSDLFKNTNPDFVPPKQSGSNDFMTFSDEEEEVAQSKHNSPPVDTSKIPESDEWSDEVPF